VDGRVRASGEFELSLPRSQSCCFFILLENKPVLERWENINNLFMRCVKTWMSGRGRTYATLFNPPPTHKHSQQPTIEEKNLAVC
jgi:hypothetical protein